MNWRKRLLVGYAWLTVALVSFAVSSVSDCSAIGAEPGTNPELRAFPPVIELKHPSDRRQVVITRVEADGSERDLTAECVFDLRSDESVASVSSSGVVEPKQPGEATLEVTASDLVLEIPIRVQFVDDQPRPISYRHDVRAVLTKAGCNMGACHGNLNGKGGFKLSLRGDDPAFDHDSLTRDLLGRRIDRVQPDQSLILLKPTGRLPHEGGLRFTMRTPEASILEGWIEAGCADDRPEVPELSDLMVYPADRLNTAPALRQQLSVIATFADGSIRDVTRLATFDVDDPAVVEVSPAGLVQRSRPGESVIVVRYLDQQAVSRLGFLHDRPKLGWSGPPPRTSLDRAVFSKLEALRIEASPTANDHVFLRRAYLDAIGILPSPEESRQFLDDDDPEKRTKLIDQLLERPEFADYWSLKWADLLRNEEETMGLKGVWNFRRWLRDQIARDRPLNEFAGALITGIGSTWKNPPASFYRTNRDPETAAESFGQIFLGVRLQCARCHNHPFDHWTRDDYYGLAATFSNLRRKEINNRRRDGLNKHVINGDVIIHLEGDPGLVQPSSGDRLPPTAPGGVRLALDSKSDARTSLAGWLTEGEGRGQFARNLANRVWYHLMGRGVVEPVDDFRDSNPPSNPELLDALTEEFVDRGFRLRPLVRLIMTSEVYGLSSEPLPTNQDDEINFAKARIRLLPAEVLLDAIGSALGSRAALEGSPEGSGALFLAGANTGPEFLEAFGKPNRLLTCECERSEETTLAQALQLINGSIVREMIEAPDNRIGGLLNSDANDSEIVNEIFLAMLGRRPSSLEEQGVLAHLQESSDQRSAWEDIAWAIINSKEFLLRH